MTKMSKHEVSCPNCGRQQTATILESINIDLDPSFRKRLIDGDINMLRCEFCNHEAFLNAPLLYHDPTKRFCVQYLPLKMLDNIDSLGAYTTDGRMGSLHTFEKMGVGYIGEPHIVFDIEEMIRYVLFRELLYERDKSKGKEAPQCSPRDGQGTIESPKDQVRKGLKDSIRSIFNIHSSR